MEPLKAIENLQGKVWRKVIHKDDLPKLEQEHIFLSTKLLSGRRVVHIYNESYPGGDFEQVPPDLEDVYFNVISQHNRKNVLHEMQEVAR